MLSNGWMSTFSPSQLSQSLRSWKSILSYRAVGKGSWTRVVGKMTLVYFSSGLREGPLDSRRRLAALSSTLARMEDMYALVAGMAMLPSERDMVRGRGGWVKTSEARSRTGREVGGAFMGTSGASSEDKSVGASEGWADDMRGVGVAGGDGERSSIGIGRGGGEGLGWSGCDSKAVGGRTASTGTGTEIRLLLMVGGRMIMSSRFSWWSAEGTCRVKRTLRGGEGEWAYRFSSSYFFSLQLKLPQDH